MAKDFMIQFSKLCSCLLIFYMWQTDPKHQGLHSFTSGYAQKRRCFSTPSPALTLLCPAEHWPINIAVGKDFPDFFFFWSPTKLPRKQDN